MNTRKIIGGTLVGLGGLCFLCFALMLFQAFRLSNMLSILSLFALLSVFFVIVGLFTFGIKEWKTPMAFFLTSSGGMSAFLAVFVYVMYSSGSYDPAEVSIGRGIAHGLAFCGIIPLALGIPLLVKTVKKKNR
jgi:hypothetical protein